MDDVWHLRRVEWVSRLRPAEAEQLWRESSARSHGPGEMVFGPTRNPSFVYYLESGLVRLFRASPSGEELTIGFVRPGELFGELAVLPDAERASYAETRRRSKVWRIPVETFRKVVTSQAGALFEVTKQIGGRLEQIESRLEDVVFRDVRTRLARLLLRLGQDFGEQHEDESISIALSLTQTDLATLIGATRQTVSTALTELREAGLIGRDRRELVLLRPQRLRALADGDAEPGPSARRRLPASPPAALRGVPGGRAR